MFGTNAIRKQHLGSGVTLHLQSVFPTIQGEGPYAGRPAIFVRLAGCNLRCFFCDTDFESKDREVSKDELVKTILTLAHLDNQKPTDLVVITGGEPFLQNIIPFCRGLIREDFDIQIETAGTLWNPGFEDLVVHDGVMIVCSPKAGKVHDKIAQFCQDWKYLIQEGAVDIVDGLPNKSTQVFGQNQKLARPPRKTDTVWLQPCEAYKVGYKKISLPGDGTEGQNGSSRVDGLADQSITSSVRDIIQTQHNIELARDLAIRFNYRISLQIHKLLGIP